MTNVPPKPSASRLFNAPEAGTDGVAAGQIGVVGIPSDFTHSSRIGTRFGPDALRTATTVLWDRFTNGPVIDPDTGERSTARPGWVADCGDAEIDTTSVAQTTEAIAAMTEAVARTGGIPLALGGDHYNSFPACLGVSRALAKLDDTLRIGYVQIDGHLDFSDRLGAWGSYNHATNARRISELPNVDISSMAWIGISGWVDGGELEMIEAQGGLVLSADEVHRIGAREAMQRAQAHAMKNADLLYLTIDIDAMDSGYLPGTGSIVHSGITPRQYFDMLDVLDGAPFCGLDIVEVSPPLDPSGRTPYLAAEMLVHVLRQYHSIAQGTAA
jgi:arginase family enzyme